MRMGRCRRGPVCTLADYPGTFFFPHLQQFVGTVDTPRDAEATCSAPSETAVCTKKQETKHFCLKAGWSKFNFTGLYENVLRSQGAEQELAYGVTESVEEM